MAGWQDAPEVESRATPAWASAPEVTPVAKGEPTWTDKLGTGLNEFFGRGDPKHPKEFQPLDLGKQYLKAGAFLVPGSGLASLGASGALYGAGASDSEDASGMAKDAALGGAGGAALGGTLKLLGKAAKPVGEYLGDKATKWGRKAITGVTGSLSNKKVLPTDVVENAFNVGAIKPFGTVEGTAARLDKAAQPLAEQYALILDDLASKGVHGPEAEALAGRLANESMEAAQNSIVGTRAGALGNAASALETKALPISGKGRLGLMQSELMKRELQQSAQNEFTKEGAKSLSGEAKVELARTFKDAIEKAVSEQAALAPESAAAFEPVKHQLSLTLQALDPAKQAAARASRRIPFGLHEAMGMATGLATGDPVKAGVFPLLMHALKERAASTMASGAHAGASALGRLAGLEAPQGAGVAGQALTPEIEALAAWLRKAGKPSLVPAGAQDEGTPK